MWTGFLVAGGSLLNRIVVVQEGDRAAGFPMNRHDAGLKNDDDFASLSASCLSHRKLNINIVAGNIIRIELYAAIKKKYRTNCKKTRVGYSGQKSI